LLPVHSLNSIIFDYCMAFHIACMTIALLLCGTPVVNFVVLRAVVFDICCRKKTRKRASKKKEESDDSSSDGSVVKKKKKGSRRKRRRIKANSDSSAENEEDAVELSDDVSY